MIILTTYSNQLFEPTIRTNYSNQLFEPPIRTNYSNKLFEPPIRTTYSHFAQPDNPGSRQQVRTHIVQQIRLYVARLQVHSATNIISEQNVHNNYAN